MKINFICELCSALCHSQVKLNFVDIGVNSEHDVDAFESLFDFAPYFVRLKSKISLFFICNEPKSGVECEKSALDCCFSFFFPIFQHLTSSKALKEDFYDSFALC